jgi:hypothetical protein
MAIAPFGCRADAGRMRVPRAAGRADEYTGRQLFH